MVSDNNSIVIPSPLAGEGPALAFVSAMETVSENLDVS